MNEKKVKRIVEMLVNVYEDCDEVLFDAFESSYYKNVLHEYATRKGKEDIESIECTDKECIRYIMKWLKEN